MNFPTLKEDTVRKASLLAPLLYLAACGAVSAQEHWTEGPVWSVSFYRTRPGHFDDYMKYLRSNFLPIGTEQKKQGLFLDQKIFVKTPTGREDWDIAIATLFPSYGKALDFNAGDDDKRKAIAAKHYKTTDEGKQQSMAAPRFEMRDSLGTQVVREVTLRPMALPAP
jgi:hypothetical protein